MSTHTSSNPTSQSTPKAPAQTPSLQSRLAQSTRLIRKSPRLFAILALLLLGLIGWLIYSNWSDSENDLITSPVSRGDIENTVTALGNLQPLDFVDVGAQATGQLRVLAVDIGSEVSKGELLAEIDPQIANTKVKSSEGSLANLRAQLSDRQAQLALANANFERQKRLMAANATSATNFDAAKQLAASAAADIAAIRGQISAAQSQLDGEKVTLSYTKIYAPMTGTVVSVSIKQGQTINSVQQAPTILRVADLGTMQVQTQVSEADVSKLKVGMPAYFTTLGNPDRRWTGRLEQIQPTPTVTNNVVLYTATFNVDNPDRALMTQMTAQVFFVTAQARHVLTIPVSALQQTSRTARSENARPETARTSTNENAHTGAARGGNEARPERGSATAERPRRGRNRTGDATSAAPRSATVLVVKDGETQPRRIRIGVSNRVSVEVLSGLELGEHVVSGRKQADPASRSGTTQQRRPGGPGMGGPGMGRF